MLSARVKVDGDNKEHTLRLNSIQPKSKDAERTEEKKDTIEVDRLEYEALLSAIDQLKIRAEALDNKNK